MNLSNSKWDNILEFLVKNIKKGNITKASIKESSLIGKLIEKSGFNEILVDTPRNLKKMQVLSYVLIELFDVNEKMTKKEIIESFKINYSILERLIKFLEENYNYKNSEKFLDAYGTSSSERNEIKKQKERLHNFLNSKKNLINQKQFLPSNENILSEVPSLKNYPSLSQDRLRWICENTSYKNYTELKEASEGMPMYKKVKNLLDSMKSQIISGKFIPSTDKMRELIPEFNDYDILHHVIRNWLKNNTPYEDISQLKKKFQPESGFPELVRKFLESKKEEILKGDFIPSKKNILFLRPDFVEYDNLMTIVIRWIKNNTQYENITDLCIDLKGLPVRDQIRNFLDSKKDEILTGKFIPTSKNLRNFNRSFGDYTNSHIVVAECLKQNSSFNDLSSLIKHFKPVKSDLGNSGRHGYTPIFDDIDFRLKNALTQVVCVLNQNSIEVCQPVSSIKSWKSFFVFLERNSSWKFVDVLTGEIITRDDYNNGYIAFHHIDRDKSNDEPNNLVFLLNTTHGILTMAQRFDDELDEFLQNILVNNILSLKKGIIPESWKKGWRRIALENGIKIDPSKYKKPRINERICQESRNRKLDKWF